MTRSRKGYGIQHLYYQYREYHRTIRRGDTVCDEPLTSIFCLCWDHIRTVRARYGGTEEIGNIYYKKPSLWERGFF